MFNAINMDATNTINCKNIHFPNICFKSQTTSNAIKDMDHDEVNFNKIKVNIYNDEIEKIKRDVTYSDTTWLNSDYTMKGGGFDVNVNIGMISEPKVQGTICDKKVDLKVKSTSMINAGKGKLEGTIDGKPVKLKYQVEGNGKNILCLNIEGDIDSSQKDLLKHLSLLMSDRIDKAIKDDNELGMVMLATM